MRLRVFVFFLAVFAATTAGHIYTIDSYLNYSVTKSLGERGEIAIPKFMMTVEGEGGRHYSKLGIGQSLVGLPLFWVGSLVERASPGHPAFSVYSRDFVIPHESGTVTATAQTLIRASDREGARVFFSALTNAFLTAGVCTVFWMLLRASGLSKRGAVWGAVMLGFCTPLWVYSRDLFGEPLFTLCLLSTFYILKKRPETIPPKRVMLAGLISSLGVLTRASFIPLIAVFAIYLALSSKDRRAGANAALRYALCALPGIVILAALNMARFGSVLLSGYHTAFDLGFSVPLLNGIAWNLASPYRSVFLYAPPVALFFFSLRMWRKQYRAQFWLTTVIVVYILLVYSKWWAWHGGWCWGPRFLVPAIPLLLAPGIVAVARKEKWLTGIAVCLGIFGFFVQLGAVLINYTAAYDFWIKIGRLDWAEEGIHLFSPVTIHWRAVIANDPAAYDLWLVQLGKVSEPAALAVGGALACAAVAAAAMMRGRP
jgi:hypothetical protein